MAWRTKDLTQLSRKRLWRQGEEATLLRKSGSLVWTLLYGYQEAILLINCPLYIPMAEISFISGSIYYFEICQSLMTLPWMRIIRLSLGWKYIFVWFGKNNLDSARNGWAHTWNLFELFSPRSEACHVVFHIAYQRSWWWTSILTDTQNTNKTFTCYPY